ncbi:glycosyltransferase family 4 protein [Luminiphilus sp.]|nr:glycosyltransferase family 4 protein [Luminiphilus sp.]
MISVVRNSVLHDSRVKKIAKSLERFNCDVNVIGLQDGRKHEEQAPASYSVMELRTKAWPAMLPFQIIKYVEWLIKICLHVKNKKIDLIICNDLNPLLICVIIKKMKGARLIYDAHELETETHHLANSPMRKMLMKFYERQLIAQVDQCITVSELIARWYEREYRVKRVAVIKNKPISELFPLQSATSSTNHKTFVFIGAIREGKGVDYACKQVAMNPQCKFKIVGDGELRSGLEDRYAQAHNIFFVGHKREERIKDELDGWSIGIVATKGTSLSRHFSLPNKVYQYLCSGMPVIVPSLPELEALVRKYDIGWVADLDSHHRTPLQSIEYDDFLRKRKNVLALRQRFTWEYEEEKFRRLLQL